jgi:hypothetical protein
MIPPNITQSCPRASLALSTKQRSVCRAKQLELAFVEHEWTKLRHPDGWLLDGVDIGIAPLIEALWARGYETNSSCENGGEVYGWCPVGMAYVSFATEAESERFARELRELPGYDPLRRVEFTHLSAYPQTVAFEARLIEEATERQTHDHRPHRRRHQRAERRSARPAT